MVYLVSSRVTDSGTENFDPIFVAESHEAALSWIHRVYGPTILMHMQGSGSEVFQSKHHDLLVSEIQFISNEIAQV